MTPHEISRTRKALGLTQTEFAALIGVSRSYIAHLEGGKKVADRATARLLSVLDIDGVVERLGAVTPR